MVACGGTVVGLLRIRAPLSMVLAAILYLLRSVSRRLVFFWVGGTSEPKVTGADIIVSTLAFFIGDTSEPQVSGAEISVSTLVFFVR